jgi:hypothetical protein
VYRIKASRARNEVCTLRQAVYTNHDIVMATLGTR